MEMARLFTGVDLMLVPSLRDEMLTISNFTGHPSLTLRTGFVEVAEARSDWAPDAQNPLPKFSPPRRVPHGVTLIGRLFDEGTIARAGLALERVCAVSTSVRLRSHEPDASTRYHSHPVVAGVAAGAGRSAPRPAQSRSIAN